jgi:hypothetical protein
MNLASIRTKLKAILNRNDCTDDLANDFITMAQTRLERVLRVPGMEKITITTGNGSDIPTQSLVIPSDFLSLKFLYSGQTLMENKDLGHFLRIPQAATGRDPQYYARVGASLLVKPTVPEGQVVTMVYYASQPSLLVDTDTNFFTTVAADLLIYGALSYAADYFVDDRVTSFEGRYGQLYNDLDEQGRMTDMDQSAQSMSPAYNTEY